MISKSATTYRILLAMLASAVSIAMPAAAAGSRPQLVMGIVVDGLDQQYLDLLAPVFGQGGFNRLMRDGVTIANADYGTNLDAVATAAVLMTGAHPATSSVTGSIEFDPTSQKLKPAMYDPDALGNFTDQTYSPKQLGVSTLADEVRIAGGGVTRALGVAADPSMAITLAGHSGNAAVWLNDRTGNWASSTYYKDIPATLTRRNRMRPLASRLDTMQWAPLRSAADYPDLPEHLTHYGFRHIFPRGSADRFEQFLASPMANAEVTEMASELIADLKLGEADGVDMLNLGYSLRPYDFTRSGDNRYELIDAYLRLDRNLEQLFAAVDSSVGAAGSLIFLAATPPSTTSRRDPEQWGIPYGEFSTKKARSLLNMYLMGIFGNGEWVNAFHGNQLYLNHKLIKDRGVDAKAVRTEAAGLLARMSGVDRVYTIDEILASRSDSHLEALRTSLHPDSAGDLFLEVDPGWELVNDMVSPANPARIHYVKRCAPATAPVYILAPGVSARTLAMPQDARVLAPTVARLLRIRSPNAASLPALVL